MGQFGKALGELFVGQQPRTIQTDPRTEYQRAVETRNVSLQDALNKQYTSAMEGPMYGLPDIPHQRYMEGELIDAVMSRAGAGGAGGSGVARAAAGKALADYRLGLLQQQATQRQKLRSDLIAASTQPYAGMPRVTTPVQGEEGLLRGASRAAIGGMGVQDWKNIFSPGQVQPVTPTPQPQAASPWANYDFFSGV